MHPLEPRTVLVEQVYERLLDAIAEGSLAPGAALAQESLAERLGVSRQPVSHALALLKQQGLVVGRGRRGLQVAPLDPERLRALYQVRAALDGLAARLAAERIAAGELAPAALATVEAALAQGRAALVGGERGALIAADVAFHRALNELSGNPLLGETAARQWPHIRRAMGAVLAEGGRLRQRVWDEHAAILAAVRAGEADRAEALARAHVERAGSETRQRLLALAAAE